MPNARNVAPGSNTTLMTGTLLNGLADGAMAVGPAVNFGTDGRLAGTVQMEAKFAGSTSAGGQIDCWWVKSADGTKYEDGDPVPSSPPGRAPDFSFIVSARTGANTQVLSAVPPSQEPYVLLPVGHAKLLQRLNGTGSNLAADTGSSTWTREHTIGTA